MKSHWLKYKDKEILFADYTNLDVEGLRAESAGVVAEVAKRPLNSVNLLSDGHGTIVSPAVLDIYKQVSTQSSKYLRRTALLGIRGTQRVFLDLIVRISGMKIRVFEDETEAKEWLISA